MQGRVTPTVSSATAFVVSSRTNPPSRTEKYIHSVLNVLRDPSASKAHKVKTFRTLINLRNDPTHSQKKIDGIIKKLNDHSAFVGLDLSGEDFRYANLRDIHFIEANLQGTQLQGADLTHTLFEKSDLNAAIFLPELLRGTRPISLDSNHEVTSEDRKEIEAYLFWAHNTLQNKSISREVKISLFYQVLDLRFQPHLSEKSVVSIFSAFNQFGTFVGLDLSRENLSGMDFSYLNLTKVNFTGALLQNTIFTNANLNGADFSKVRPDDTCFDGASLEGAIFYSTPLDCALFLPNILSGKESIRYNKKGEMLPEDQTVIKNYLEWMKNTLHHPSIGKQVKKICFIQAVHLKNADYLPIPLRQYIFSLFNQHKTFTNLDLRSEKFIGYDFSLGALSTTDLPGIDFSGTNWSNAHLDGADFRSAILNQVDFSMASLVGADFNNTLLIQAKFVGSQLANATFIQAVLTKASFSSASMQNVILQQAKCHYAQFKECDLMGAQAQEADCTGANFDDANISRGNFTGAILVAISEIDIIKVNTIFTDVKWFDPHHRRKQQGSLHLPSTQKVVATLPLKYVHFSQRTPAFIEKAILKKMSQDKSVEITDEALTIANKLKENDLDKAEKIAIFRDVLISKNNPEYKKTIDALNKLKAFSDLDLSGEDLSGSDLSGLHLTGVKLNDTILDGVNWGNTLLEKADLSGASFFSTDDFIKEKHPKLDPYKHKRMIDTVSFICATLKDKEVAKEVKRGMFKQIVELREQAHLSQQLVEILIDNLNMMEAFLGLDLSGEDYSRLNLSGLQLKNVKCIGAKFVGANLDRAVLAYADLEWADMTQASCTETILRHAHLKCTKWVGAQLHKADLTKVQAEQADFTRASLTESKCNGANLFNTVWIKANLSETNFSHAQLIRANFHLANLTSAILDDTNLTNSKLTQAQLNYARLHRAKIEDANLTAVRADKADFSEAHLQNISMNEGYFTGALFIRTHFIEVVAIKANFEGAFFADVKLVDTEMMNANLNKVKIMDAEVKNWNTTRATFTNALLFNVPFPHAAVLEEKNEGVST